MKERFFLILSTSGGAGHIRAAQALHQAAQGSKLPIRTQHFDCLDFTSRLFKKIYSESYLAMVNHAPEVWGYLYSKAEQKPYNKKGHLKLFDHFNYQRYLKALRRFQPDAIICTHFLPYISISDRVRKEGIEIPFFAVTTDFDAHQLWVDPIITRYYVHHEESAWQLHAKGVTRERIQVLGIPVHREFGARTAKSKARKQLGIGPSDFTVLLLSGGFGVGRIEPLVTEVNNLLGTYSRQHFNLLIVCGKNEKVKADLAERRFASNVRAKLFGFVNNIHELMDSADVLISKSGGLTSAEAMAKQLPMIVVDPIPGQETRNADMIVEHGAGFLAVDLPNLGYKLKRIIENPSLLKAAKAATLSLAKPNAAQKILTDVYNYLEREPRKLRPTDGLLR